MESTDARADTGGTASWPERAAFVLALVFLGLILTLAAQSEAPSGGDRVGRRLELVELIAEQQQRAADLAAEAAALEEQVATYEAALSRDPARPGRLQQDVDAVAAVAGLTPLRGPGLRVTLRDSELPLTEAENADVNDLVIHEQDLQAVVNALWAGGAEALSINGQRVLATSAVRCVGNILLLNGRVHPPPYVMEAIGDVEGLTQGLDRDVSVTAFRRAAEAYGLGYDVEGVEELVLPAYGGPAPVEVAEPAGTGVA